MRRLPILNITPSITTDPSSITVNLDFTAIFHGKEWIDLLGTRSPFFTYTALTAPVNTKVLVATTFEIVENVKYNGVYTVYTPLGASSAAPSLVQNGNTVIHVRETMATDGAGADLTTGTITHISTYLLHVQGEPDFLVLEQSTKSDRAGIDLLGRLSTGWGESFLQNLLRQVQCFAGAVAPVAPVTGQLWLDTNLGLLKIFNTTTWGVVNGSLNTTSFRSAIAAPGGSGPVYTWNVPHALALSAPYICTSSFFVDIGGGVHKAILPNDITFSANSLTASFSQNYAGQVIVRV